MSEHDETDGQPPRGERILDQDIEDELKESYLTYAMSVIISRALPDVRDGLKPSQRRILVAMNDLNLSPRARYVKCAKIVGECMGNYHPHGDQAIYPTLVRMAQPFSTRYMLVDGQGNFGSVDGDPPAAMRYTEAKMLPPTVDLLQDLDMETVDTARTFDDRLDEPTILPARFPNLLCNGSTGIAVGLATRIPPHNVVEVCDALQALIEKPDITVQELMEHVQGPDFPTGAQICGRRGIHEAYRTGRGHITLRSRYHVEEGKRKDSIVFTELPYQENKVSIIEKISHTIREGLINGIADVRDESDKNVRLVVELKADADPELVVNQLFSFTSLQTTYSIINIALVNGRPETLSLKDMLNEYKKHRMDVIRRRTRYQLRKAEERAHIVEGLLKALDHIDAIIELIRSSASVPEAQERLMSAFEFTEIQAREILNMRLQRLTGLERQKLVDELAELKAKIESYRAILRDEALVLQIIIDDLKEIRERYGDERRTEIVEEAEDFDYEDLITEEDVVVTVSNDGYIKRTALSVYRNQGRGGKGITGSSAKEGDFVKDLFVASTHAYILFFTNRGKAYWLKVHNVPDMARTARGRSLVNLIELAPGEVVSQQLCVKDFEGDYYVVISTRRGFVKKTPLEAYSRPLKKGIIAIKIREDDELIGASLCAPDDEIILGTRNGMAIRFHNRDVRPMGRGAAGVGGISLRPGDEVVGMVVVESGVTNLTLLTVCENGFGKRTPVSEYRFQKRNGGGTINIKVTERNGRVVSMKAVTDEHDIVLITRGGIIMRTPVSEIRSIGRATQGVRIMNVKDEDQLTTVERVVREDPAESTEGAADAPEEDPGIRSDAAGGGPSSEEHGASEDADSESGMSEPEEDTAGDDSDDSGDSPDERDRDDA